MEVPHLLPGLGMYALIPLPTERQFQDIALRAMCCKTTRTVHLTDPRQGFSISFEDAGGWMHRSIHLWAPNKTHLWVFWLLPPATYSSGVLPFFLLPGLYVWGPVCEPTVSQVDQCILFWLLDFGSNSKWRFQSYLKLENILDIFKRFLTTNISPCHLHDPHGQGPANLTSSEKPFWSLKVLFLFSASLKKKSVNLHGKAGQFPCKD